MAAAETTRRLVRSSTRTRLPAGLVVEVEEIAPASYVDKAYRVFVDGKEVGLVETRRTTTYRKEGRLRGSAIGHPRHWTATTTDWLPEGRQTTWQGLRTNIGYRHDTRIQAIAELVGAWLKPHAVKTPAS